jgi:hypothetical protein
MALGPAVLKPSGGEPRHDQPVGAAAAVQRCSLAAVWR